MATSHLLQILLKNPKFPHWQSLSVPYQGQNVPLYSSTMGNKEEPKKARGKEAQILIQGEKNYLRYNLPPKTGTKQHGLSLFTP